ncbi:ArsR/SmtB family transcription factor [Pseudogracilibacillus auburnensis]|uniref:ArsR/SmtB family transcription factor n=1 Tax=Pseudogracilibacillus auburnensis TaxID=1494959 RepID=UPI001A96F70D|nr:metalloregulator ArsR/SmtB family transcription factor [Pseudogracilibacillus auburnensis]MBO1004560.1 winged helix-turn-helix transcriptional regulator [Pseudogracilibacillus auburnensis]
MITNLHVSNKELKHFKAKFKALSDENRLYILHILAANGKTCVCDLSEQLNLSQSRLSYHLKVLMDAYFISVEKQGKWNYYFTNREEIKKVLSPDLCCLFYPE